MMIVCGFWVGKILFVIEMFVVCGLWVKLILMDLDMSF